MKTLTKIKIQWLILIFQILFLGLIFAATAEPRKSGNEVIHIDSKGIDVKILNPENSEYYPVKTAYFVVTDMYNEHAEGDHHNIPATSSGRHGYLNVPGDVGLLPRKSKTTLGTIFGDSKACK